MRVRFQSFLRADLSPAHHAVRKKAVDEIVFYITRTPEIQSPACPDINLSISSELNGESRQNLSSNHDFSDTRVPDD